MSIAKKLLMGSGGKKDSTYIDDVFSTYVFKGNAGTQAINNGIDLAGEGGMVWTKNRTSAYNNFLYDTNRGVQKYLISDVAIDEQDVSTSLTAFNSNGFTLGANDYGNISNGHEAVSWTFRKQKGFFDVVTYTGNDTADRTVAHNLGSVPGFIIVKSVDSNTEWVCYHHELGNNKYLKLNATSSVVTSGTTWSNTDPTSTHFTVGGTDLSNKAGDEFVAYVFAGGESTNALARSVDFDASGDYLSIPDHSDWNLGGTFTIESWIYLNPGSLTGSSYGTILGQDASWYLAVVGTGTRKGKIQYSDPGATYNSAAGSLHEGQWNHIAFVANSGVGAIYINGTLSTDGATPATVNCPNDGSQLEIGRYGSNNMYFNGKISNLRVIKGTALYTSSFIPPTEPLKNITNTKLLCCNNSSVTGSTVTPDTITANGDPTASTDSPFDDPEGFKFGEGGDQNIVKCGSYVGNDNNTGPVIDLGWEPQWILIKNTNSSENWHLFDNMRGIVSEGNDAILYPNLTNAESDSNQRIDLTSTGFKIKSNVTEINGNGNTMIYMAFRRPDGYVGKPVEAGTEVFAMPYGSADSATPQFRSPTVDVNDFTLYKQPAGGGNWYCGARLLQSRYWLMDNSATSADANEMYDYMNGYGSWTSNATSYVTWIWKRHAGFDVQTYTGVTGAATRPHSMGVTPEMIWVKRRNAAERWCVGHKGLNGGTNPWEHYIRIESNAEYSNNQFYQAPTSTHWSTNSGGLTNNNGDQYIAMLFASVEGISKVGSYTGSASEQTITLGFQPRFIIIKGITGSRNWLVLDTTRGWGSGNDSYIYLNSSAAQGTDHNFGAPTSNGFTVTGDSSQSGGSGSGRFIYYAHA